MSHVCGANKMGECAIKDKEAWSCTNCCKTAHPWCGGNFDPCYCPVDYNKAKIKRRKVQVRSDG